MKHLEAEISKSVIIIQEKNETILDLTLSLERIRINLKEYIFLYLQQKGKVNIRGALEFCFQEILKNTKTLKNQIILHFNYFKIRQNLLKFLMKNVKSTT
jgi:hypothetical protein